LFWRVKSAANFTDEGARNEAQPKVLACPGKRRNKDVSELANGHRFELKPPYYADHGNNGRSELYDKKSEERSSDEVLVRAR